MFHRAFTLGVACLIAPAGCSMYESQAPRAFMTKADRVGAPTARLYALNPQDLEANDSATVPSMNNRLVRVRGTDDTGRERNFDVFFGPTESNAALRVAGRGRFKNADPQWNCTSGYAILRGWRPFGSGTYIKAVSDSTTLIFLVEGDEERVIVREGKGGASVYLDGGPEPGAPNLTEGHVMIARMEGGKPVLGAPVAIKDDPTSVALLDYLDGLKGARDALAGLPPVAR
jgi:hypothetical protein